METVLTVVLIVAPLIVVAASLASIAADFRHLREVDRNRAEWRMSQLADDCTQRAGARRPVTEPRSDHA